jgi:hypothetical protein
LSAEADGFIQYHCAFYVEAGGTRKSPENPQGMAIRVICVALQVFTETFLMT